MDLATAVSPFLCVVRMTLNLPAHYTGVNLQSRDQEVAEKGGLEPLSLSRPPAFQTGLAPIARSVLRISAKAAKKGMEGVAKDLRDVFNKVQSIHMTLNRLKHRAEKEGHLEDVRILEQISLDMSRLEAPALERFQAQEAATFAVLLGGLAEGMTFK